jgi:hypothetical protein
MREKARSRLGDNVRTEVRQEGRDVGYLFLVPNTTTIQHPLHCARCRRRRRPALWTEVWSTSDLARSVQRQSVGRMVEPGKRERDPNRAASEEGEKWAVCRGVSVGASHGRGFLL